MADLQTILAKLVSENRQSRERFEAIASRTVFAVSKGDTNELSDIIRAVTHDAETAGEGGAGSVETGKPDGTDGDSITPESSSRN